MTSLSHFGFVVLGLALLLAFGRLVYEVIKSREFFIALLTIMAIVGVAFIVGGVR